MYREFFDNFDASYLVPLSGLCLFAYWLLKTSLGRTALSDSKPRRNTMPAAFPWAFLLAWLCVTILATSQVDSITAELSQDHKVFIITIVQAALNAAFGIVALVIVKNYFARRLKGFGINFKKIPGDFFYALAYLFAALPVVFAVLRAALLVGKLIYGADYQIERHNELVLVRTYTQPSIQAALIISGVVVTPFFEEILFRGLIQSTFRSLLVGPWRAIAFSSLVFALVHPVSHWPAIVVLGIVLGYAYEKSGSLFRPMFIHVLFNGLVILATMCQS